MVSPGCMLFLPDDEKCQQLFSRAAYEILQRKLKLIFHCTSFKQWSVLKNGGVTSEMGGVIRSKFTMNSENFSELCPQSQRLE